jgi:hypothetical protein
MSTDEDYYNASEVKMTCTVPSLERGGSSSVVEACIRRDSGDRRGTPEAYARRGSRVDHGMGRTVRRQRPRAIKHYWGKKSKKKNSGWCWGGRVSRRAKKRACAALGPIVVEREKFGAKKRARAQQQFTACRLEGGFNDETPDTQFTSIWPPCPLRPVRSSDSPLLSGNALLRWEYTLFLHTQI